MVLNQGQWAIVYTIAVIVFLVIDGLWLTLVMKPLFVDMLGDKLRIPINIVPAAAFYVAYVVAILFFAVSPSLQSASLLEAALRGAALGLIAYGTYDMTNLATLQGYKLSVALIDTAWGGFVTGLTATAGYLAARWLA